MPETTAQVFAEVVGLKPETAGWAYRKRRTFTCSCRTVASAGPWSCSDGAICGKCRKLYIKGWRHALTASSPLAESPTPGWLEVLVGHAFFDQLVKLPEGGYLAYFYASFSPIKCCDPVWGLTTTHAVARALIASDPALRARLEACEDWEELNTPPRAGKEDE